MKTAAAVIALTGILAGCATQPESGSVYNIYQTMNEQVVRMGTVESVRNVTIASPESGVGTMSGAALGGLAGSEAGGGKGAAIGAVAGGTGTVLATKGREVEIAPGTVVTALLQSALTVRVPIK